MVVAKLQEETQITARVLPQLLSCFTEEASLVREASVRSSRLEQSQSIGEYMATKFQSKDSNVVRSHSVENGLVLCAFKEGLLQFMQFVDENFPPAKDVPLPQVAHS